MYHVIVKDVLRRTIREIIMKADSVDAIYRLIEQREDPNEVYLVLFVHPVEEIRSIEELSNVDGIAYYLGEQTEA